MPPRGPATITSSYKRRFSQLQDADVAEASLELTPGSPQLQAAFAAEANLTPHLVRFPQNERRLIIVAQTSCLPVVGTGVDAFLLYQG
jgi:hypothetical protein